MSRGHPIMVTVGASILGALLTLGIALVALEPTDALHLIAPLAGATAVTVGATWLAGRYMARSTLRIRFAAIAAFASLIGLVNLAVLASLMLVSEKDAVLVAALLVYAAAAAIGAGMSAARRSSDAAETVADVATRIAGGDLSARAGYVGGGRELEELAVALDQMAEQLARSIESERATEQRRRDLVVAVSHDLRTPLAGLRAMAEAIEDGVVTDPKTIGSYSGRMRDLVESLTHLVDDLFEFVQLDAGAIEAETQRAMVSDVIASAVRACDAQAIAKGLELRMELGDAAALACSPRLTRVVQNLLQNAIRHTPSDGSVLVEARRLESGFELAVEDTGEGIADDVAERIFEPFWRGDSARTSEGSGLGLALAHRIVEALEGSIEVSSPPHGGARFAVLLPQSG